MIDLGISNEEFQEHYFERAPYFQTNALRNAVVTWSDLSACIYSWDMSAGGFIVHQDGVVPPPYFTEHYQDVEQIRTRLVPHKLEERLSTGATLVLNRLERKIPSIGRVCSELSRITSEKTVANGYVAFGGQGTFGKHWDTHDVFAVQLLGQKLWRVYRPTFELPLPTQRSRDFKQDCPLEPVIEQLMKPGDILYLPRGWWHEALPIENTPTFHIAAGIHTAKAVDYVQWAMQEVMPKHIEARRSFTIAGSNESTIQALVSRISKEVMDPELIGRFVSELKLMGKEYQPVDLDRLI